MNGPTPEQVTASWAAYAAHTLRDGRCQVCDVPHRCWTWAIERGWLIAHGLLPDTRQKTSGGETTSA